MHMSVTCISLPYSIAAVIYVRGTTVQAAERAQVLHSTATLPEEGVIIVVVIVRMGNAYHLSTVIYVRCPTILFIGRQSTEICKCRSRYVVKKSVRIVATCVLISWSPSRQPARYR